MWKRFLLSLMLVAGFSAVMVDIAEARRMGGGRSTGIQRSITPPTRQATPPQQQAAPTAAPPQQASGWRRFAGPLAGLAAGLGLAALLSHFGIGAEFAGLILLALVALVVFALLRRFLGNRGQVRPAYAGASDGAYERTGQRVDTQPARFDASQQYGSGHDIRYPAGFDAEAFARQAKVNFIRLQAANDSGNLEDIREFTSPEMFAEIKLDVDERGDRAQKTDVVVLEAEVLEVVEENGRYIASVRYHGMIREEADAAPQPFDEIWHLTKPVSGSGGWILAGIQQSS